jgi:hypothetical protein
MRGKLSGSTPVFEQETDEDHEEGKKAHEINKGADFVLGACGQENDSFHAEEPEGDGKDAEEAVAIFFPKTKEEKGNCEEAEHERAGKE